MENQLFRKKSLERISSPEELHDYMRVTSPRLWMLLIAIVALLVGFIVYASTVTLENTIPVKVIVENMLTGEDGAPQPFYYSVLPMEQKDIVASGMKVRLGNAEGRVELIAVDNAGDTERSVTVFYIMEPDNLNLRVGEYDGELVIESTTPISFLWN